ncbi:hypothetical protein UMM65_04895 [Aureibaculum sp. 2210JD6-5]|uniref:hypothetical protein n=1 Tax=Aureibaculum sp. 2210JD6-5 TaxID=3103957 RepID=UPI002AACCC4B|nr:hypothetical protein [Aureibaculum sp. 2210JD6-5]MDY7394567.1 hypothetical protein [Aureibaculum sp. 2210JD6-5]
MKININPTKTLKLLVLCILIIVTANCVVIIAKINLNYYNKFIFEMFNLDQESNVPTYFSTLILFFCTFLLALISLIHKKLGNNYLLWMILSICFLFLSVDEFISIHERIGSFLENKFKFTGVLYYSWVIPYSIFVIILAIVYFKYFLLKLPKKIRFLFIISGGVYITGAVGLEMLGSKAVTIETPSQTLISILYTIEETLEMIGISIFIYTLLIYLKEKLKFKIRFKSN